MYPVFIKIYSGIVEVRDSVHNVTIRFDLWSTEICRQIRLWILKEWGKIINFLESGKIKEKKMFSHQKNKNYQ